jgi:hypothetical protein
VVQSQNARCPSESQTLVDADLSFHGSNEEDEDEETKPVATIRVGG